LNILISHFLPNIVSGAEIAIGEMVLNKINQINYTMLVPGKGNLSNYYKRKGLMVWERKFETKRRKYPGIHFIHSLLLSYELRKRKYDIVLANTFPASSRVMTACKLANIPLIIIMREYISDKPIHRKILREANHIFTVSKDLNSYLTNFVNSNKITTVYDFININQLRKRIDSHKNLGKRILPYQNDFFTIGFVGRITSYKQPDLFIRAIPKIIKEIPNSRFVIVGDSTKNERFYLNNLKILVEELGIQKFVSFLGYRKDTIEIISELSVICLTSIREPFPRVVLEAQAIGCPVVSSDTGGCLEIVRDGETGLLFSPKNDNAESALASNVIKILESHELRKRITSKAKSELISGFGHISTVNFFEKCLFDFIK